MQTHRSIMKPQDAERVVALYREGRNYKEVAQATGLGETTVRLFAPDLKPGDPKRWNAVEQLLKAGKSQTEVVAELKEKAPYVSSVARRWRAYGGRPYSNGQQPAPSGPVPAAPKVPVPAAPKATAKRTARVVEAAEIEKLMRSRPGRDWVTLEITQALQLPMARKSQREASNDLVRAVMSADPRFSRVGGRWTLAAPGTAGTALSPEEESQKIQLLKVIVRFGPFATESDLTTFIHGMPEIRLDGHAVSHLLYPLKKQGKIDFREGSQGPNGFKLERIESTVNGRAYVRTLGAPLASNLKPEIPETKKAAEPAPHPVLEPLVRIEFPLLAALKARVKEEAERRARAAKYLAAAEILAGVDTSESERLLSLASDTEGQLLTPLEIEYLGYATSREEGER